jgi:outer membrane protein assembly factor BamE (lipoprotein component of BamABCDE complex)
MTKKNLALTLTLLAALGLAAACTPMVANRGNMIQDHQMVTIEPGTSTKSDVLRAMGSPTTQDPFDENIWYYIGQVKEKKGILDPKVTDERIVMVQFDADGIVNTIKDVGGQGEDIPFDRSKTPTSGNEMTVLQQFFGNLGKFNAASAQGQKGR